MTEAPAPSPAPPARRRRFRPVEVVDVRPMSDRLISVTLTGGTADALDGFEITAPGQHVKMLFPGPGEHDVALPEPGPDGLTWPPDRPRPAMRTYTPRRFDAHRRTLEVQLVLHGEGPAAAWAARAAAGDRLAVAGPGGRMSVPLDDGPWIVAGDESAVPGIGTLLEALPAGATADVIVEADGPHGLEVEGTAAHYDVATVAPAAGAAPGSALEAAVAAALARASERDGGPVRAWVACEAAAVRRIRRVLLDGGVGAGSLVTRGYWRLGEADHPDHDHGED